MVDSSSAPLSTTVVQIMQLVSEMDARLPKVQLGQSIVAPTLTSEQFDSLTASW